MLQPARGERKLPKSHFLVKRGGVCAGPDKGCEKRHGLLFAFHAHAVDLDPAPVVGGQPGPNLVAGGGCSGYQYGMALAAEAEADDTVVAIDGLRILIDPDSAGLIGGAEVLVCRDEDLEGACAELTSSKKSLPNSLDNRISSYEAY